LGLYIGMNTIYSVSRVLLLCSTYSTRAVLRYVSYWRNALPLLVCYGEDYVEADVLV